MGPSRQAGEPHLGSHSGLTGPADFWFALAYQIKYFSVGLLTARAVKLVVKQQSQAPFSPQREATRKVLRTLSKSSWLLEGDEASFCLLAAV